jgi:hypothetical protein
LGKIIFTFSGCFLTAPNQFSETFLMDTPRTNTEIRRWYKAQLALIPQLNEQWIKENVSLADRAYRAWKFRHEKRAEGRKMMQNPLQVKCLEMRDIVKYGRADGPTFEFLVAEIRSEGVMGNDVFEAIIKGSYRTNAGIDKKLGF